LIYNPKIFLLIFTLAIYNQIFMAYFRFGARLAFAFFIVGTVLLIAFYLTLAAKIVLLAYYFTLLAIFFSWFYAAILLFNYLRRKLSLLHLLQTIGVMAINIPLGILYSGVMVTLLTYARITFINATGDDIGPIKILGCEQKEIIHLKKGETETCWIKIVTDCQVTIEYAFQSTQKKETVVQHLMPTSGMITRYTIGRDAPK
jgi:hypothetical protein